MLLPSGNNVDSGETVVDFTDVALFWGESSKCKDNEGIAVDSVLKNKEIGGAGCSLTRLIQRHTQLMTRLLRKFLQELCSSRKCMLSGRMVCPPLKNEYTNVIMVDWPLVDPKLSSENE